MVVNAAGLADLPTDGHATRAYFVLEEEMARVVVPRKTQYLSKRLRRTDADDEVIRRWRGEIAPGDRGDTFDAIVMVEFVRFDVLWPSCPADSYATRKAVPVQERPSSGR